MKPFTDQDRADIREAQSHLEASMEPGISEDDRRCLTWAAIYLIQKVLDKVMPEDFEATVMEARTIDGVDLDPREAMKVLMAEFLKHLPPLGGKH